MSIPPIKIGWRTIKTVVAVMITLLLYEWLHRQPAALAALACVFTLRNDVPTSIKFGRFRVFGNSVGATIAGLVVQLELLLGIGNNYIHIFTVSFGVMLIIVVCNQFNHSQSIVNASATYFVVLLTISHHDLIWYTVNRVLDAFIGATIAVTVNRLLPGPFDNETSES
ncbi:FUSC family protein [Aerococcaceae bacterium zg-ZJ1578]|uniref:FUSC family protein n=1 Tax=Aerococcaceae bacterium zg-252 TaxID=2796928 RepID=UPI001A253665|nr:FUSC family protein [Aerococcaceae bacterium zg-1578]